MNNLKNNLDTNKRQLGYIESYHYILSNSAHILRNVVVAVELNKSFNPNHIVTLLKKVHKYFTALHIRIEEYNGIPFFIADVPFNAIPIKTINNNSYDNNTLINYIEDQMNIPIDIRYSTWRAKLIISSHKRILLLAFHHSIFDGRSIIKLLKYLESINLGLTKKASREIYPPIEDSVNLNQSEQKNSCPTTSKAIYTDWPIDQPCDIKNQQSKCHLIEVNSINVNHLKNFCRKNFITINQLLNALIIRVLVMIHPEKEDIIIHTPINLTPYSTKYTYHYEIGCFISVIKSMIMDFKNKDLLRIAKLYSHVLNKDFCNFSIKNNFDFYQLKNLLIEKFKSKITSFSGGIAVSNVGEIKLNEHSIVKDVIFSTSLLGGLGIFVLSVLTINNQFRLTLSYTDPLLSQDFVIAFERVFKNMLSELMKEI